MRGEIPHHFFVAFGQKYLTEPHPDVAWVTPDGVIAIDAETYQEAREIAIKWFGLHWSMLHDAESFTYRFWPLGVIGTATATTLEKKRVLK
jgi:hypothetical protein